MATRYIGTTSEDVDLGDSSSVVGAASGGTLAGSQVVQVVFNDAIFTSSLEGKQRLLNHLDFIRKRIEGAKAWPITSSS